MSTIADKIKSLVDIKTAIKSKLAALGLNPSDKFASYASNINSISNLSLAHLLQCKTTDEAAALPTTISIAPNFSSIGLCDMSYFMSIDDTASSSCKVESITFPSNFNTSNVITFASAFSGCSSLTSTDLSTFNVSKCTSFVSMFYNCTNLTTLGDISSWDISKGSNLGQMFKNCSNLVFPNLSTWSLINAASVDSMFSGCKQLTQFTNESVMHPSAIGGWFYGCDSLESVSLPNISLDSHQYNPWGVFIACPKLHNLVLGEGFGRIPVDMTLDLSQTSSSATTDYSAYTFSDDTWSALLGLYDRSTFNTTFNTTFTIIFHPSHKTNYSNWDTFVEQMTARNYTITIS